MGLIHPQVSKAMLMVFGALIILTAAGFQAYKTAFSSEWLGISGAGASPAKTRTACWIWTPKVMYFFFLYFSINTYSAPVATIVMAMPELDAIIFGFLHIRRAQSKRPGNDKHGE